jgi:hypothetical protein
MNGSMLSLMGQSSALNQASTGGYDAKDRASRFCMSVEMGPGFSQHYIVGLQNLFSRLLLLALSLTGLALFSHVSRGQKCKVMTARLGGVSLK